MKFLSIEKEPPTIVRKTRRNKLSEKKIDHDWKNVFFRTKFLFGHIFLSVISGVLPPINLSSGPLNTRSKYTFGVFPKTGI